MAGVLNTGIEALATPTEVTLTVGGNATVTQGYHTIAANSGTGGTLSTISIDAALATALSTYMPEVIVKAKSGHSIVVAHSSSPGADNIMLSTGTSVILTDEKILRLARTFRGTLNEWHDGGAVTAPSGGFIDANSVQTMTNKTLTSPTLTTSTLQTNYTFDGIIGSYAGVEMFNAQIGTQTHTATPVAGTAIAVAANRGMYCEARVIGVGTAQDQSIGGRSIGIFNRDGSGSVVLAGTKTDVIENFAGSPSFDWFVNIVTNTAEFRLTGIAGTISWGLTLNYNQVSTP